MFTLVPIKNRSREPSLNAFLFDSATRLVEFHNASGKYFFLPDPLSTRNLAF